MDAEKLNETQARLFSKLHQDLGSLIMGYLKDSTVNEIILNSNGRLWINTAGKGMSEIGALSVEQAHAIISNMAGIQGFVINHQNPALETIFPAYRELKNERFTALVPPLVSSPCFAIRKRAEVIYTFQDYLHARRMTPEQLQVVEGLIARRANIVISGSPGDGKTTFINALMGEMVNKFPAHRFIVLEDTPELQCLALNHQALLTSSDFTMTQLLKKVLRLSPDHIVIGEVRGAEVLVMLKAWNTGCPGGVCSIHANGAEEALQRIVDLCLEAGLAQPPFTLIAHTVDAVISVVRKNDHKGFISEIIALKGVRNGTFEFETLA